MKKITVLLFVVVCIGVFNSCKTREKCPAYGKAAPLNSSKSHS